MVNLILFLSEINLKKNYCSIHTFFKWTVSGFKGAGSIIEANIKYIKQQMETLMVSSLLTKSVSRKYKIFKPCEVVWRPLFFSYITLLMF